MAANNQNSPHIENRKIKRLSLEISFPKTKRAILTARTQEMKAKVVEAESMVPTAMAEAFRAGNMGIMDYYKLENIRSDTTMRDSIADTGSEPNSEDPVDD